MRVIYIDIDSLRADHLGCYGYPRDCSPVIDEITQDSAVFTGCHTSDAPCLPSRAALFSGLFGINNGVTCHDGPASQMRYPGRGHTHDPAAPLWMRVLQKADWETVCFSGFGQRHMALWFGMGFTQNFGNQLPGALESADEVTKKATAWLEAHGTGNNWFMHVNYWDVHHPYRAPQKYYDRVRDQPPPLFPTADQIAEDVQHYYGSRTARDWWNNTADWQRPDDDPYTQRMPKDNPNNWENYLGFVDGQDAGLVYVDEKIGEILELLERLGIREETAIIISSDHGESVGELGMYFEHGNACEGTTHVPLIIHWPGITEGGSRHDGLMYSMDLAPTVLELLGIPAPPRWDARSVASNVRGNDQPLRSHLVIGAGIFSFQRAVRTDHYRLIRTIHSGVYPYDPLYLFDMQADPWQRNDLSEQKPEVVARLDHLLLDWLWQHTTGPTASQDPFAVQLAAGFDPDLYCSRARMEQRLVDVGRDDQLADLRRRRQQQPVLHYDTPR